MPRVFPAALGHQTVQRARRLVAHGHQRERRVVAVGFQDEVQFVLDVPVAFGMLAEMWRIHRPERNFDLQEESRFVGGRESRFGGTPRMETHIVESIGLADRENAGPLLLVHRRIARQRIDAFVHRSPHEERHPVDGELLVFDGELADAVAYRLGIPVRGGFEPDGLFVQHGAELVPLLPARRHRQFDGRAPVRHIDRAAVHRGADAAAGRVAHFDGHPVAENLHVPNPHRVRRPQLDTADNAVPVTLRVFRQGMHPRTDRNLVGIVHADRQHMPSRRKLAQIVDMRRRQAVLHAERLVVHPHVGLPMATLQQQLDTLAAPCLRNLYVALVPSLSLVADHPRQSAHGRLRGRRSETELLARAGQFRRFGQRTGEPLFADTRILFIQRETPFSGQRNRFRLPGTGIPRHMQQSGRQQQTQ